MFTLQLRVWGRVQGVGFRYFTKLLADKQQIHGMVQNKLDGSVIITIQAEATKAYHFADSILETPPSPYAKIAKSTLTILEDSEIFRTFSIH